MPRTACERSVIFFASLVTLFASNYCASEDTSIYHNEFAVYIPSGPKVADEIAQKYGFVNTGQIGTLENYYLFKMHRLRKRSVEPAVDHEQLLKAHPEVEWVEQQVEMRRVKRDGALFPSDEESSPPNWKFPYEEVSGESNASERQKRQFFGVFGQPFRGFNFFSPFNRPPPTRRGSKRFPDPLFSLQWYFSEGANGGHDMNVVPAWTRGYTGKGVVVSILDDGIQHNHPDLAQNYRLLPFCEGLVI